MFFFQLRHGSSSMLGRDVLEEIQDFDRLHLFRCVCMLSQRLGVQDRNSRQSAALELNTYAPLAGAAAQHQSLRRGGEQATSE